MNTVRVLVISFAMLCLTTSMGKAATTGIVDGLVSTEMNAVAVPETAHMANLIGEWSMSSESRQQDGSWQSSEGQIADWNFFYTLDGQAIQDVWIAPPRSVVVDDATKRQIGSNIRIYWPEKKEWEMVWVAPRWGYVMSFTATSDDEKVVMLTREKTPQGHDQRITFFNMTGDTFDWEMERSEDDGETWTAVFRLHGTKKK